MRGVAESSGMKSCGAASSARVHVFIRTRDIDEIGHLRARKRIDDRQQKQNRRVHQGSNDVDGVPQNRALLGALARPSTTGARFDPPVAPEEVGRRQVEIFLEEDAPMDRIAIGHSADSTDVDFLEELLRTGVYLSMDRYPGAPGRPNWEQRNSTVKALIDRGWAHKLMLGHDHAPGAIVKGTPRPEGPEGHGPTRYLFVSNVAIPALMAQGVDQATIDLMMREVPRRFLAGE